ncbi:MAG: HDIG domain-containing metalloprotein [Planctomycetota bacterium]
MSALTRKSRWRRLTRERDAARVTRATLRQTIEKLWPHLVLGAAFTVLCALLLSLAERPLPVRVGERASFDIVSRVAFSFSDEQATRNARYEAVVRTPYVYRFHHERFDTLRANLTKTLEALARPGGQPPADSGLSGPVTLSEEEADAVRKALAVPKAQSTGWFLQDLFLELEERVFISDDRYETERNRSRIAVRRGDAHEVVPVANVHPEREIERELRSFGDSRRLRALDISGGFFQAMVKVLAASLKGLYEYDLPATELAWAQARDRVEPIIITRHRKDVLVNAGETITEKHLLVLEKEREAYHNAQQDRRDNRAAGLLLVTAAAVFLCAACAAGAIGPARVRVRHWSAGVLVLLILVFAHIVLRERWSPYVVPLGFVSVILSITYGEGLGLAASALAAVLMGILFGNSFLVGVTYLAGAVVAVIGSRHIADRIRLMLVGVAVGAVQFLTIYGLGLVMNSDPIVLFWEAAWGLAGGIIAGLLATGLLPFIERLFNVSTSLGLLELSDLNTSLMQRLAIAAPGTYNHSLIVGHLAEAGAKAVGANALLSRVGSFYHDIGKMNKPEYFVENRGTLESKHTRLSPRMSALVIIAHTKDGLELAAHHKLLGPIRDIIAQHHGTTLVQYFYEQARQTSGGEEPNSEAFRYPGPKPQTKEAAIVMLADAVESASRTLREPTPSRVQALVTRICEAKLKDGQLDECELTLKELKKIADELTRALSGMFHARVVYPSYAS